MIQHWTPELSKWRDRIERCGDCSEEFAEVCRDYETIASELDGLMSKPNGDISQVQHYQRLRDELESELLSVLEHMQECGYTNLCREEHG